MKIFSYLSKLLACTLFVHLTHAACKDDNCLNNLNHNSAVASSFCATYTTQPTATIAAFATSACSNNATRVTSACSCFATPSAKPLHRVYGGLNGVNDQGYFIYDDYVHAINIRSDGKAEGNWQKFFDQCHTLCEGYASDCQTMAFALSASANGWLCYIYNNLFNQSLVQSQPGNIKLVVDERYQS